MSKKTLLFLLLLFLLCSCKTKKEEPIITDDYVQEATEPFYDESVNSNKEIIAVFGVDSRSNRYGIGTRSDSIMLAMVDKDEKTVKVASILRDCLMHIEGHDYEKVTHAHSYGGPELAIKTLNENLDLNIDKYVTVNFNSVGDLVDMMGGIEQNITDDELESFNIAIKEINEVRNTSSLNIYYPGDYLLDGTQSVAYSRIRHAEGGDYKRSERQRTVLFKIFEKAKDMSLEDKLKIMEYMFGIINTNLTENETLELLKNISGYTIESMESYPQVFYAGLISYDYGDRFVEIPFFLTDMNKEIHVFFSIDNYKPSETVLKHSEYISGLVQGPNTDTRNEYGNGNDTDIIEDVSGGQAE